MNICNLTKLGTGNPSLSLSLMIYLRKAKTKFLCAAYSSKQYYSSSQTSVLTTGKAKFHYDMRFEKKDVFTDKQFRTYFAGPIYTVFDRMSARAAHLILGAGGEALIERGALSRGALIKYFSKDVDTTIFWQE